MYEIGKLRAGDFIDLENYFKNEEWNNFFVLLTGEVALTHNYEQVLKDYIEAVIELKSGFEFIYNPPPLPTTTDIKPATIGDEYRKEFVELYGGYVELVYLVATTFKYKPEQVLKMKCIDFLFWGNYLLHKKFCESIK
jgi:hypothetical protein